ncbi:MAG: class I SAM-dependent methyltransferase [Thiolinea sp.]
MPEPDSQQIQQFDNQRAIYHHAIAENYMAHREIHTAIQQHLNALYDKPFSVLDLGCGEAEFISKTLKATLIKRYTGIDRSNKALKQARKNLDATGIKANLLQGDHTDFKALVADKKFRVIIIGFSLYQLQAEEKVRF